jgi:hypothetical protein
MTRTQKLERRNSMLLFELHHTGIDATVSRKFIDAVMCFTLTDNMICERASDDDTFKWNTFHHKYYWLWRPKEFLDIYIPKKLKEVSLKRLYEVVADNVYYKHGFCYGYFAVEIDRLPKDMKMFRWLVYHNAGYLMNANVSWEERVKKLKSFLDIEGDK